MIVYVNYSYASIVESGDNNNLDIKLVIRIVENAGIG
jgi:hypothetical protein